MTLSPCLPDPSARLTAAFELAARRMRGLPIVNPALRVEAVAFAPWDEHWLGVMLTPWCMNLTLVPRNEAAWRPLAPGAKRRYPFPAGEYEFIGGDLAGFGSMQSCSLFSPVHEFRDHDTARRVAALAREALLTRDGDTPGQPVATRAAGAPASLAAPGPIAALQRKLDAPLSKRNFLRGAFVRSADDDRG